MPLRAPYVVTLVPDQPFANNFSKYLLDTFDKHANERFVSWYCNPNGTTVFVNTTAHHAAGEGVATMVQEQARVALGNPAVWYRFWNDMLPFTPRESQRINSFIALIVGFFILIPFTFVPSTFVSWVVKEKETHAKHLQTVSGMIFSAYWCSNFVFDAASALMTSALAWILLAIFQREEYTGSSEAFGCIVLLFLGYSLAAVSGAYLSSFAFKHHAAAQNVVMLASFISGFLLVILAYFLGVTSSTKDVVKVLKFFFRLVPSYCLGEGLINLANLPLQRSFGRNDGVFDMDTSGWALLYLFLEFPIFFGLTMLFDHPSRELRRQQLFHDPDAIPAPAADDEDGDVKAERIAVEDGGRFDSDLIAVKHLRKVYATPQGPKVAVKNLSFGVKKGELFAFLGTNGAGKTTTMSILTGEQLPTNGRGRITGKDVVSDALEVRRSIGYCPQFDALHELLTPREHLDLYAALRGLDLASTADAVEHLITLCDLDRYVDIPAGQLSGGNKRKLSLAISMVGAPPVLFLDEPSAGMDPKTRRKVWSVIQRAAAESSVVLTTHHLEEVEALSDRVAIMVAGELRCIGALPHLKQKFGSGYEVMVKVDHASKLPAVEEFFAATLPAATLLEVRDTRATYQLPREGTRLSDVLLLLGERAPAMGITDYSLAQTSLELVFLRISEENEDPTAGGTQ